MNDKMSLARVRGNLTENATVAQVLHPDIKAMSVEFTVTKPGRYEITVDRRDDSVELHDVPGNIQTPIDKFSRRQLISIVTVMIASAIDYIESGIDSLLDDHICNPPEVQKVINPAIAHLALNLFFLYAMVTHTNMGATDAVDIDITNDGKNLDGILRTFGLNKSQEIPSESNNEALAEAWVNLFVAKYLA